MKVVLRIGDYIEIVRHESDIIIADHENFRYIKMKDSVYLRFIENKLSKGMTQDEIYEEVAKERLNYDLMNRMLEHLLELKILIKVEWLEDKESEISNSGLNEPYNGRFIHEIEAFSFYEKYGVNRFQAFEKIRSGSVAIIGAGGVGSNIAVMLCAAGIGEIILVDEDQVEESNLVRQVFYEKGDCGKTKKVVALKRFLNKFSDYTKVSTVEHYIKSVSDAEKYLGDSDVVVQTADTPRGVINRIINDYSTKSGCASIYCANGTVGPFYIPGRSGSFRDLETALDRETAGLYDLFVEAKNDESSRGAPSEVGGPWLAAFYLYSEIVDYFAGIQRLKTENAIIRLSDGGFSVEICPFNQIG